MQDVFNIFYLNVFQNCYRWLCSPIPDPDQSGNNDNLTNQLSVGAISGIAIASIVGLVLLFWVRAFSKVGLN